MGHFSANRDYGASRGLEKQWGHLQVAPGPAPAPAWMKRIPTATTNPPMTIYANPGSVI